MCNSINQLVETAAAICIERHRGQTDKVGTAYILHPMRVAAKCSTDCERIVALLHDVVEDTDMTPDELLQCGFPQRIVDSIMAMSRNEGESYDAFIERCASDPIARRVKLFDLEDNMNVLRLNEMTSDMVNRYNRYIKAHKRLMSDIVADYDPGESDIIIHSEPEVPAVVAPKVASAQEIERMKKEAEQARRIIPYNPSKWTGKSYQKERPMVTMPDRTVICEPHGINTLIEVVRKIGIERVAELNLKHGKYDLIADSNVNGKYAEIGRRWILSNFPNVRKVEIINEIGRRLNLPLQAILVAK